MKHKILGLLVGGLTLAATASPAMAAKVSVEVEGLSVTVPATTVVTSPTVTKGGGSCPNGENVLGALDALTKGDWDGSTFGATRILSEDHPFIPGDAGWVFTINGRATADYGCTAAVKDGDKVLWYASAGFGAYHVDKGWEDPVLLDAPATAVPGQAFVVTATNTDTTYDTAGTPTGTTFTPSQGATISGGTAAATTGADGKAQVAVAGGPYTLVATKDKRAPARIAGCATDGHDGFCGTTASPGCPVTTAGCPGGPVPAPPATTPVRPVPTGLTGVTEGRKYAMGMGPRELAGHVNAPATGLRDVRLRLTRTDGRACATFDAKKETFVAMRRCGAVRGTWFSVGAKGDFRYLLPTKLPRGRYVLDLQVRDTAGKVATQLARGTTRVVFIVA
jgi:hypothetical protein